MSASGQRWNGNGYYGFGFLTVIMPRVRARYAARTQFIALHDFGAFLYCFAKPE